MDDNNPWKSDLKSSAVEKAYEFGDSLGYSNPLTFKSTEVTRESFDLLNDIIAIARGWKSLLLWETAFKKDKLKQDYASCTSAAYDAKLAETDSLISLYDKVSSAHPQIVSLLRSTASGEYLCVGDEFQADFASALREGKDFLLTIQEHIDVINWALTRQAESLSDSLSGATADMNKTRCLLEQCTSLMDESNRIMSVLAK